MPKILEYPRDSLSKSLDLAEAANSLGGSASIDLCAERLGRSNSGGFAALVGAAGKYGLIEVSKSRISTTELFTRYKHSYNDTERKAVLVEAIRKVPVFDQLLQRFEGKAVPEDILEKILVREYRVSTREAGRVASYFLDAIQQAGIGNGNSPSQDQIPALDTQKRDEIRAAEPPAISRLEPIGEDDGSFRVTVAGPGFHSEIRIVDEDDLLIVDAMIGKIRRKLKEQ